MRRLWVTSILLTMLITTNLDVLMLNVLGVIHLFIARLQFRHGPNVTII
jgi:hypothetical protein